MNPHTYQWVHERIAHGLRMGWWPPVALTDVYEIFISDQMLILDCRNQHDEDEIVEATVMILGDRFRRAVYEIATFGGELPDVRLMMEKQDEDQTRPR